MTQPSQTRVANKKTPTKMKSRWTYKAVEHGAGHPSCEAHVEERPGCAWTTHSLQSSSTSSARGAGITILLPAGARPPLDRSEPLFLPTLFPHPPDPLRTSGPFPLLRSCGEPTRQSRLSFRKPPHPPPTAPRAGRERARWCLTAVLKEGGWSIKKVQTRAVVHAMS